jgi:hypothetical protein
MRLFVPMPDGKRFVMPMPAGDQTTSVVLVENWQADRAGKGHAERGEWKSSHSIRSRGDQLDDGVEEMNAERSDVWKYHAAGSGMIVSRQRNRARLVRRGNPQLAERAMSGALLAVRGQRGELSPVVHCPSEAEQSEGVALSRTYERFIGRWPANAAVEFSAPIAGANIVASCRADLSIGTALYEIKTVSRNFQSRDIRQLLIYLALQAATGDRRRPPSDVLVGFVLAISRDAEIETRF